MATLTLLIDHDVLREAAAQAIMGMITPELRVALIEEASGAVLAPSATLGMRGGSAAESAFAAAVEQVALKIAQEHVESNANVFTERLAAAIVSALLDR